MTEQNLEMALRTGPQAVIELLKGAAEATRRKIAPTVLSWDKDSQIHDFNSQVRGVDRSILWNTLPLALLGCCTLSELKKARLTLIPDPEQAATVLVERNPEWLRDYMEWALETNPRSWSFARYLEKTGILDMPAGEASVTGMILQAGRYGAYQLLTSDPELIERVDRLFEVEGNGELSLAAYDKYTGTDRQWATALIRLSQEGRLSRQHLLSRALQALSFGFAAFRAGWFSRFYDALKPSPEEVAHDMDRLLSLLASPVPSTASFALKTLTAVSKKHKPDPNRLLAALDPVWTLPQKGPVLQGLKLLLATPPGEPWLEHLTRAARHPAPEVQREALKGLKKVAPKPTGAWREQWLAMLPDLEPSVRGDWSSWVGGEVAVSNSSNEAPRTETCPAVGPEREPEPVAPCQSLQEVLDLAARLLEELRPPHDIERLLDGLCRFAAHDHPQSAALLKRVRTRLKAPDPRAWIAVAVSTWLGHPERPSRGISYAILEHFLERRLHEINDTLKTAPLLHSLPERADGALSVATLAERLRSHSQPREVDFAQAILRLDPEDRAPISGSGEAAEVLRYALGGPAGKRRTPIWWEAADLLRDSRMARAWTFHVKVSSHEVAGKTYYHRELRIPELANRGGAGILWADGTDSVDSLRWQATLGPALRESFQLLGIEQIANNLDWWSADWSDRVYLETLLERAEPWQRAGAFLAALGLSCKEPGQRGLAVDAVAQGLASQRLSPARLGQAMGEISASGMITPRRWATSFEELRQFVPQEPLLSTLEAFLASKAAEFDARPLLAPLLEIVVGLGQAPHVEGAQAALRELALGGGKAAKQAARILSL